MASMSDLPLNASKTSMLSSLSIYILRNEKMLYLVKRRGQHMHGFFIVSLEQYYTLYQEDKAYVVRHV